MPKEAAHPARTRYLGEKLSHPHCVDVVNSQPFCKQALGRTGHVGLG